MKVGVWTLMLGLSLVGCAGGTEADRNNTATTVVWQQMRADLLHLAQDLRDTHPDPFHWTSESAFGALVEEAVARIGPSTTQPQFLWEFSRIVAAVGCGHTRLPFFQQEEAYLEPEDRFPVEAYFVGEQLFVLDPLANADRLEVGAEIVTINGIGVEQLLQRLGQHVSADAGNPAFRRAFTNIYLTAYLPYELDFPPSWRVELRGGAGPIELNALREFSYRPLIPEGATCRDRLCFDLADAGVATMTIRDWNYYDDEESIFREFIDESFRSIRERAVTELLIDVRGNFGGSGRNVAYLLSHLSLQPIQYFDATSAGSEATRRPAPPSAAAFRGRTWVLVDPLTQSATGHFLAHVKDHQLGTIVGQAAGSGAQCFDSATDRSSPELGVAYRVARSRFVTPAIERLAGGIEPDVRVVPTIEQVIEGRDPLRAEVLRRIALD